jgi:hypothetical protein
MTTHVGGPAGGHEAATRFNLRQESGRNYFDARERAATARQSVRRPDRLGFQMNLHITGEVA